ncbi:MAG: MMPL family transporter [Desulfobacteraceae bacterium]|nr:MMPL family transporter [Desulfobacteraceae bacterium]
MPHLPRAFRTDNWFRFIIDHPYRIIFFISLVTLLFAIHLPYIRFQTSIYDLAIKDLSETAYYEAFKKEFGSEEIILVVAKAKQIFDPDTFRRIGLIAQSLSEIPGVRKVLSLPGIKKDMDISSRWSLSDFEEIMAPIDLFRRNFISDDKKTTVLTVILEDVRHKDNIIGSINEIIEKESNGMSLYQIGMPLVSRALAAYTEKDFFRLPPITFLVIAALLFCFFGNIRGILIPTGSVFLALIWTFGLMAWTQTPLSLLTMIVPILLIAVGTAYCMHIMSEYRTCLDRADSQSKAVYTCFMSMGLPTTLAVITTIIGLGSLLLNKIASIREFAVFSCIGMASMLIIMITLLPAVLTILPLSNNGAKGRSLAKGAMDYLLAKLIRLNLRHQKGVLYVIAIISALAFSGIFFIRVETNPVDYFKQGTPIAQHFEDVYKQTAGSFPVNVVLDSKAEGYFEKPSHLKQIERIQGFLNSLDGVDKTISFADFLKLVNYATNQHRKEYYALPGEPYEARMLMNSYKTLLGQDMFKGFMNEDLSKVNILLRTHISSSRDFLELQRKIQDFLKEHFSGYFDFHVTGFGMVISQSSHLLTRGLIKSLSLTLLLIFGIMALLFFSSKVGFIAILPNCFPIIINFGIMGWLGINLSVATSLIASIAVGLAVDDTIHYLVRYNREFKKDLDKDRSLCDTIRGVGRPIIFTTMAISLGFSILIFSHFKPTAVFGLLMVTTMFSALIGDLLILPSLMRHVELVTAWDLLKLMPTMGGISAGIAHELNQPLNAIKMGGEFLKMMIQRGEKIPKEDLSQVANEISVQVDRASEIISRLSQFGGKPDFEKEEVDINTIIRNTLATMAHQLALDKIETELHLDETLPPVLAHRNRLGQVVFNLISNAKDAINEKKETIGGTKTDFMSVRSFSENDRIVVSLSDSGIGIPDDVMERIFEPFFTTKEAGKGKGLGLTITNEIVKDYGGRIDIRSEEGEGTTFTLTFPKALSSKE